MNVIVFDIGGTLMEYVNMPNVWIDYYDSAFRHVREKLGLPLTDEQLEASIEVLKRYNPRVKYREKDYTPEQIQMLAAAAKETAGGCDNRRRFSHAAFLIGKRNHRTAHFPTSFSSIASMRSFTIIRM